MKESKITEIKLMKPVQKGNIVVSTAGHDKGLPFAVVGVDGVDGQYLLLADGKTRLITKPKKKKIKHCRVLPEKELSVKLFQDGKEPSDAFIRKYLKLFLSEEAY
jgi:ribosomal protein L14E/L6E/L27E